MAKQAKAPTSGDNIPQKKKGISLKAKVRKHITDINDVISDADIRDARPETTEEITEHAQQMEKELEKNAEVNDGNAKDGKKNLTPWDVLNE